MACSCVPICQRTRCTPPPPCTDTTPPEILPAESFPAGGTTAFANPLPIVIQFSEAVCGVSDCNVTVTSTGVVGNVPGVVRFFSGDDTAMFIPSVSFGAPGSTVTVTVAPVLGCPIVDMCRNQLSITQGYSFLV